ncbi:MAG: hypothetical protein WD648_04345 [Planctomycetaceae bacterium]
MAQSDYPLQSPTPKEKVTVAVTPAAQAVVVKEAAAPKRIFLVSYPKIVFLYPTLIAALLAGIYMAIAGPDLERNDTRIVNLIFLMVLGLNLVVLSFDFPRTTSLTLFFALAAIGVALWFLFYTKPEWWPLIGNFLNRLRPFADSTFYFIFVAFLLLIYVAVFLGVQFDYWEVRPNELLHHHGFLSDLERFSAPNLRIDKEINDLFEYLLMGSGRLILHPSNERRAIVLENVFFINRKEQEITRMLGALQVQMRTDSDQ